MITYKVSKKYQISIVILGLIFAFLLFFFPWGYSVSYDFVLTVTIILSIPALGKFLTSRFHTLKIDSTKISYKQQFITKSIRTIEAHQLEGVAIKQGPLGRIMNYGKIEMTGTGGIKIKTIPFDDVYSVAQEIRNINPKLSDNQFKVAQDDRPNGGSTAGELEKLSQLLEKGLITREEFDSQKRKLLG